MTTYKIAMLGDFLIATASTDELLRERAEAELTSARLDAGFGDLDVIEDLTLFASIEDAEAAGADIVYIGSDQGFLEDDAGRMEYAAAGIVK